MAKNVRWTPDDMKKKGLVQNAAGDFVKVSSLVSKNVEKIDLTNLKRKYPLTKEDVFNTPPLNNRIDGKPIDEEAYTGDFSKRFLIDEVGQWETRSLKDMLPKYAEDVVKAEKERAANPNKPHFHYESPRMNLPNKLREVIHPKFIFDLAPCPAPRMSRSDKWKTDPDHPDPKKRQRPIVTRYFKFRDDFRELCRQQGFELDETIRALFIIPFPESFTNKKMKQLMGQPHKQRPDCDNYLKSILDSFNVDDGYVWDGRTVKIWGDKGQIIIF